MEQRIRGNCAPELSAIRPVIISDSGAHLHIIREYRDAYRARLRLPSDVCAMTLIALALCIYNIALPPDESCGDYLFR